MKVRPRPDLGPRWSDDARPAITHLTPYQAIVGVDMGLREVMRLVSRVADADTTVLVRGETGSGKELIAHAIHRLSRRRQRRFLVANCAAIPHELMESEVFGHARGAFTGAVSDHAGYFEAAGAGTLLLDEVGDLDRDLQAKILRVLEDGSFRRVGSAKALCNRARIVASTHQPLESLMERGLFREDLYYRLNVFPIHMPPLRERREDIPALVQHFLRAFFGGADGLCPTLTPDAMEALREHPWWGNVRELRNSMERIAVMATEPIIDRAHVLNALQSRPPRPAPGVSSLQDMEKQAIADALSRCRGNRTRAAAMLGIGRRTLQNKLKAYELDPE